MMLAAYGHYKRGFLPEPGGWADQASTYAEAMRFIDNCAARCEKDALDG